MFSANDFDMDRLAEDARHHMAKTAAITDRPTELTAE